MTDMRNLYQEVILDHNRKPRNFGELEGANRVASGHNPLCGDNYQVYMRVNAEGVIEAATFTGAGCAISKAAASMMTARVKGRTEAEAAELVEAFRAMLTGAMHPGLAERLGHLSVFEGVSQLPQRIKCAVLPWHALQSAMDGGEVASTEGEGDMWTQEEP